MVLVAGTISIGGQSWITIMNFIMNDVSTEAGFIKVRHMFIPKLK